MSQDLNDTKKILDTITSKMEAQGITRYKLHKLTGKPKGSVYKLFTHDRLENYIDIIATICNALDIKIDMKDVPKSKG